MSTRGTIIIGSLLLAAAGGAGWWGTRASMNRTPPAEPTPSAKSKKNPLLDRIISSGPLSRPRDYFRVIDPPTYLSVDEAAESMSDDEVVVGLELAGECRAYPINYLNDHELVREEIGGLPLLVSW